MNWRHRNQRLLEHLPALRRYARALTGNQVLADELVQDCYVRACSKFSLWRRGSHLRRWLFTLMHNLHANQMRGIVNAPETDDVDNISLTAPDNPEVDAENGMVDLGKALFALPLKQREVLLLVCLEEMKYDEVAHTVGIPIGTVMSRLSRARENLKKLMSQEASPRLTRVK